MRTPTSYYAFASLDRFAHVGWYINTADTKAEANSDVAWLKRQGCQVGPIVRVPIPKRKRSRG